jgi:hypothetical protein
LKGITKKTIPTNEKRRQSSVDNGMRENEQANHVCVCVYVCVRVRVRQRERDNFCATCKCETG